MIEDVVDSPCTDQNPSKNKRKPKGAQPELDLQERIAQITIYQQVPGGHMMSNDVTWLTLQMNVFARDPTGIPVIMTTAYSKMAPSGIE